MTSAPDIHDEESLKAWLSDKPHELVVLLAARVSARVLPAFVLVSEKGSRKRFLFDDMTVLAAIRACLIAFAAASHESEEIVKAARWAAKVVKNRSSLLPKSFRRKAFISSEYAVRSVEDSAKNLQHATFSVSYAADAFDSARGSTFEALQIDAALAESAVDLFAEPIWPGASPLQSEWERIRKAWSHPASPYDFFRRWYETLLAPATHKPFPDAMLYKIALIDDAVWEEGAEAVAKEIAEIEAEFAGEDPEEEIEEGIARTPYGEVFEVNRSPAKPRPMSRITSPKMSATMQPANLPPRWGFSRPTRRTNTPPSRRTSNCLPPLSR